MNQSRSTNLATTAIETGLVKSLQTSFKPLKFYNKVIGHLALDKKETN